MQREQDVNVAMGYSDMKAETVLQSELAKAV
jgi:hypothetical protein